MNFDFSDEQLQLQEAVRRWAEKSYPFTHYRATVQSGGFLRDTYAQLADLGLCGLLVDETHGGLVMGAVEAMLVMQELGAALVLEPLTDTFMVASLLACCATPQLQSRVLPSLANGTTLAALAWIERGQRYSWEHGTATAVVTPNGYAVTGTKSLVSAGDLADAFVVPARLEGTLALFWVERGAAGLSTRGYGTQDGSRAAEVTLHNCPATLICRDAQEALALALDVGMACACAQGVGVMDKVLRLTADYLNTRRQFGVTLSTFQVLRHRMADMKMQLELARSMSYYATLKLAAPPDERRAALARAKVQLGQSMRFVGQQSVQLHGGIGVTDEYIGSHYFKKLTQLELSFGDTLHHLGEVSARMSDSAGVFA